jgi:tetratricopeptide (TPR) repeat protein
MELRIENQVRSKKELTNDAIALALKGEWERAAEVNRVILDLCPGDVEAMNRLGKALIELGQYEEAREVLGEVVRTSPYNTIAKKNLARLDQLGNAPTPSKPVRKGGGAPQIFIEESGKSGTTVLQKPASGRVVASIAPGDPVSLEVENGAIIGVYARDGEYLGRVEPKLGKRLIGLINGGNQYEAAIIGVNDRGISIIIRETYRHPSLHNVCSFPTKSKEENRVYLGDSFLRYIEDNDLEEDEDEEATIVDDSSDDSEWEE